MRDSSTYGFKISFTILYASISSCVVMIFLFSSVAATTSFSSCFRELLSSTCMAVANLPEIMPPITDSIELLIIGLYCSICLGLDFPPFNARTKYLVNSSPGCLKFCSSRLFIWIVICNSCAVFNISFSSKYDL